MLVILTRVLPNKKKTPVIVNTDNVQWAQSVTDKDWPDCVMLKMLDGPEVYVDGSLGDVLRLLDGAKD